MKFVKNAWEKIAGPFFWLCLIVSMLAAIVTLCKAQDTGRESGNRIEAINPICLEVAAAIDTAASLDSTDASRLLLLPYEQEIKQASRQYGIPAAWLASIIQQESLWSAWAERTEPTYLTNKKVKAAAKAWSKHHGGIPTYETELTNRATSMGVMQPLGEVAREEGDTDRFLSALFLPKNSIEYGARKFRKCLNRYGKDTLSAVAAYNAGSAGHGGIETARYVYRVHVGRIAWQKYFKDNHTTSFNGNNHDQHEKTLGNRLRDRRRTRDRSVPLANQGLRSSRATEQDHNDSLRAAAAGFDSGTRHDSAYPLAVAGASQPPRYAGRYPNDPSDEPLLWIVTGFVALVLGYCYMDWRYRRHRPGYDEHLSRYEIGPLPHRPPTRHARV